MVSLRVGNAGRVDQVEPLVIKVVLASNSQYSLVIHTVERQGILGFLKHDLGVLVRRVKLCIVFRCALMNVDECEVELFLLQTSDQFHLPADPLRVVQGLPCHEVTDAKCNFEAFLLEIKPVLRVVMVLKF